MSTKLGALWDAFQAGKAVANPAAWKTGQITAAMLVTFLSSVVAAAKVFGYDLPISDEMLSLVAASLLSLYGLFNHAVTVISTEKIGFFGKRS
jgi:hypothetical protein